MQLRSFVQLNCRASRLPQVPCSPPPKPSLGSIIKYFGVPHPGTGLSNLALQTPDLESVCQIECELPRRNFTSPEQISQMVTDISFTNRSADDRGNQNYVSRVVGNTNFSPTIHGLFSDTKSLAQLKNSWLRLLSGDSCYSD